MTRATTQKLGRREKAHVCDQLSVACLLVGHVLNDASIVSGDARFFEFSIGETLKTVVEEVKLNVLLVEGCQGGVITHLESSAKLSSH